MAKKRSKRYRLAAEKIERNKTYSLAEALALLKDIPKAKYDESVDVAFHLGVDPKQSDQMVRGTVSLPHGSGKTVRIAVFAKGTAADEAKEAGADIVGYEDLIKKVQEGYTDFDIAIATPDAMQEVRKLGKILGPRGLMPNPRTGTVTEDVVGAIKEFRKGRVEFKVDKSANLHVVAGKASFKPEALEENIKAVVEAVAKAKPQSSKGKYFQSMAISLSVSPSIRLDAYTLIK
ncbi:50S ribosomal protein L1 [Methylacidiphilum caldifontis]|uniref:Large ribosomal subunit protein uL1 n=1 Tax=Methylacidiphilum caldifontis TaxID=2795386 RepID=A0A4Y8PH97_9BACT|nr:50S ribosomal protein L1 [Methylacidiphilum caldifontis]QSR89153.1 50S ribosomal protein L1 [Methylacidiphilum caldifontis]TFE72968.1 50S ribosomal protein L1 [Methylacidiphilum caldifontis]